MPLMNRFSAAAAAAVLCIGATAHAQTAPKVEAAWARPTVQGQSGGGGYLKITGGSTPDRLLSARAGISQAVELHTMEMDGTVMRMRPIQGLAIPAGQVVELKPGSTHVMFVGLTQPLKSGASFPLTLRFEKAGDVQVDMKVRTQAGPQPAPAGGHEAHKH